MKPERDDEVRLDPGDARFVTRLTESYTPRPQTPTERMDFARALDARLVHRRRWAPALAGAGATAALAALFLMRAPDLGPTPDGDIPVSPAAAEDVAAAIEEDLEMQLFYPDALLGLGRDGGFARGGREDALPADYAAIASAFLHE